MKIRMIAALFALIAGLGLSATAGEGNHRIGAGVNYWTSIDDVEIDDIDEDGLAYVIGYQYDAGLLGFGVDFEMLPDRFGEDSYAPQAYLTLGGAIYAGAGIGIVSTDGEWADDPFFSLRAGLDLEILPSIHLDIFGQYRFESEQDLEDETTDIDTDTIYLGAALRIGL